MLRNFELETNEELLETKEITSHNHTIVITGELFQQIQQHLQTLKRLEGSYSKKKFIQEAINEKLEKWENTNKINLLEDKPLHVCLSDITDSKIETIVEELKVLGIRYSKKEFFVSAICEKLEKDADRTKQQLLKFLQKASERINQN